MDMNDLPGRTQITTNADTMRKMSGGFRLSTVIVVLVIGFFLGMAFSGSNEAPRNDTQTVEGR